MAFFAERAMRWRGVSTSAGDWGPAHNKHVSDVHGACGMYVHLHCLQSLCKKEKSLKNKGLLAFGQNPFFEYGLENYPSSWLYNS